MPDRDDGPGGPEPPGENPPLRLPTHSAELQVDVVDLYRPQNLGMYLQIASIVQH